MINNNEQNRYSYKLLIGKACKAAMIDTARPGGLRWIGKWKLESLIRAGNAL
jgi:hypothetical protein